MPAGIWRSWSLNSANSPSIDVDIDPTLTGFSTGEIDVILTSADDPDDEVLPPVPVTARTKPGDIWILGDHRLGCGDGRDAEFLQRVIGDGARVDAAFLDPPYNVPIGGNAVAPRPPSRVRHGLGRDERGPSFARSCRYAGRRGACFARWRHPLHLHGLATHGQTSRPLAAGSMASG